jgi:hypothetical protein
MIPIMVTEMDAQKRKIYNVPIEALTRSKFLAPKYCAIMIVPHEATPIIKEISEKTIGKEEPTAASPSVPMNLPTTTLSTILYSC